MVGSVLPSSRQRSSKYRDESSETLSWGKHVIGITSSPGLGTLEVLKANDFSETYLSSDENPVDIPLYWLVNRDPYIGLL